MKYKIKLPQNLSNLQMRKNFYQGAANAKMRSPLVRLHFKSAALLAMRALAYGRRLLLNNNFLAELPSLVDAQHASSRKHASPPVRQTSKRRNAKVAHLQCLFACQLRLNAEERVVRPNFWQQTCVDTHTQRQDSSSFLAHINIL